MGIFGSKYVPKITPNELKRARNDMAAAGLTRDEREEVMTALSSHQQSDLKSHVDIDAREVKATLDAMEGMSDRNQNVPTSKLQKTRAIFDKYLK